MRANMGLLFVGALSACRIAFDPLGGEAPGDGQAPGDDVLPTDRYAQAVLADGPIAYFRFDEPTGPTVHSVVGSITGTYNGPFEFRVPGAVTGNPAVRFDGASTRIELGDVFRFPGTAAYTFELWVRPTRLLDTRFVIDRGSGVPREGYSMYLGEDFFLFARVTGSTEFGYVNSFSRPPVDVWIHAAATYDGTTQRLYLDGVLQQASTAGPIGDAPGAFVLGDTMVGQFNKFAGELDELAIYDRALTESELAAHIAAR